MPAITQIRLKQLIRAEAKLKALEAGGVDNWICYKESLKEYFITNRLEETCEALISELEVVFGRSKMKAGIAFNEEGYETALSILKESGVIFKEE